MICSFTLISPFTVCFILYTACLHSIPGIYENGPMMSYFGSANLPKRRLPLISSDSGVVNLRNIPFLENKFSPSTFLRRQMYCRYHSQIWNYDTGSPRTVHPDSMSARIPYADRQYPPERLRPHRSYIPRPFSIIFRHSRSYSAPYTYSS